MNKHKEAIKELTDFVHSELDGTKMLNEYIGYIETIKEFVDKAYFNCFPVYVNETYPYHNQNIPTLEQVKKEWENEGFEIVSFTKERIEIYKQWIERIKHCSHHTSAKICIKKDFFYITGQFSNKYTQLLTKTFKALGWYDEQK